jgi:hypothetical protein
MDLDARQTRNLLLASTVCLPEMCSETGVIALYRRNLTYGQGQQVQKRLLMVVEQVGRKTIIHQVVRRDVTAVYIHGDRDGAGVFRISKEPWVDNFERGEWFVLKEINRRDIRARLGLPRGDDISTRDSVLRGIAFVVRGRPLLRATEVALAAGEDGGGGGYPCCRSGRMTCCKY